MQQRPRLSRGKKTLQECQSDWSDKVASSSEQKPVTVGVVSEGIDRFETDAVKMLLFRASNINLKSGQSLIEESERPASGFGELAGMRLLDIANHISVARTGQPLNGMNPEEKAKAALKGSIGPWEETDVPSVHSAVSFNTAGDFPNLLSNLAGKILDRGYELAEVTFPRWCNRIQDVPDFKPKTVMAAGMFSDMDEVTEDEEAKQLQFSEEMKGWLQIGRFGNKVGMTPIMVANDDLDAFIQQLLSLAYAHDNKLNSLCVGLLTANAALVDGISLFNASHGNLKSSGSGAPSTTQAEAMKLLHANQTGVGTTKRIRSRPRVVLVPTELEDAALQVYASFGAIPEMKTAQTDATLNLYRGKAEVVTEADLADTSTSEWYTVDTKTRTIVYGFQQGWGRAGQRRSWYEPGKETRYIKLEGRFNAAAVGYRGICKNNG